jgi:hypothetical protein
MGKKTGHLYKFVKPAWMESHESKKRIFPGKTGNTVVL